MSVLGDKLRELSDSNNSFFIPDEPSDIKEEPKVRHSHINEDFDLPLKKEKKKDSLEMNEYEKFFNEIGISDNDISDTFDGFIESIEENDDSEDSELYNSILSMGRKYARETQTAEMSEIQKAFSGNEKELNRLIQEIRDDKNRIAKVIRNLSPRTASPKNIHDLQEILDNLHNTELGVIKEKNSMKAKQIDLSFKAKAQKKEEEGDNTINGNLIRDVLGMGRKDVMDSVGGYAGISGARTMEYSDSNNNEQKENESEISIDEDTSDDEVVRAKYFQDSNGETESDKYLKYQDSGAHYILLIDENENKTVIAEDSNGNVLDDYPIPDISECTFDVDDKDNSATDDYFRRYIIRRV